VQAARQHGKLNLAGHIHGEIAQAVSPLITSSRLFTGAVEQNLPARK